MATYYSPVADRPAATNRSGAATIGVAIGTVTCAAMVAITTVYALKIQRLSNTWASLEHFPTDNSGAFGLIGIALVTGLFGIAACGLALRTNGWRITTAVLGFVAAAVYVFAALACLGSALDATQHDSYGFPGSFPDGFGPFNGQAQALNDAQTKQAFQQAAILVTILAFLALASAILIVCGNRNGWYTPSRVRVVSYELIPAGFVLPQPAPPDTEAPKSAGWYPIDDGRLRWWNGHDWTEHFHDGR